MSTKIIISRPSRSYNMLRGYKIFIDDRQVGKLSNGKTQEFEVMPGLHTVTAKIDWCRSQHLTIHIREGETKYLEVDTPEDVEERMFYYISFGYNKFLTLKEIYPNQQISE